MRVVLLSDHPGAMLREARQRRAAPDAARPQRRWGAWLRGLFAVFRPRRPLPAAGPRVSQPAGEEGKLAAGVAGESFVAGELGRALDDRWTLLRGYHNRRGEIDLVLLGPRGLFAIEVKNQNGRIDCHGDQWWSTRYDKYGNQVEARREMSDRRGRSPSVQLNEPASLLEGFLASRGHPVTIGRVVALVHPRSQLGRCTRPTVEICTSVRELLRMLDASPVSVTPSERAALEQLIVRDHRFHAQHRPPGQAR
ncbi:MAG TPA: nuclease-related domain-containing protein [Streptosporangiaceae bacterium]